MTLALLQKGTGGALVVCAGPMPKDDQPWGLPAAALKALGPRPCVVGCNARGVETRDEILAFAKEKTGRELWLAALVGFSAGCQKVRALWLAGSAALALVLADGLHAHKPPDPMQIDYARAIVANARAGALLTIVLHTYIEMKPDIMSTVEMARTVTGWPLSMPQLGQTVRRCEGRLTAPGDWPGLVIYSTGSRPYDKTAHEGQALRVLPVALAAHVRQLVEFDTRPADIDTRVDTGAASTPEPPAEVVLQASGAEPTGVAASSPLQPVMANRIVLVGDSLAQGLGPALAEIARSVPCAFQAVGKKSTRVRDWLRDADLDQAIGAPAADLVLVCLGTNDMRTSDPAGAGAEGGALLDRILATGASVTWIGPPRMAFDTGAFRSALAQECSQRGVRICDSQALDLERAADGIHLTPKGYRIWAQTIAAWVPFAMYAAGTTVAATPGRLAASSALVTLLGQLDARWPSRSRRTDGIAPSAAHHRANPKSDHEVGNALDITRDPTNGPDLAALATALLQDPRTHYVIFQRRIANPEKEGGAWRPYTGANPHEDHLHLSIYADRRDDATTWDLAGIGLPASPPSSPSDRDWPSGSAVSFRSSPAQEIHLPTLVAVEGFGLLDLEDYVARVVTAELGASRQLQALEAQAMAARSYVVWMVANQGYGTRAKPVPNSTSFQVCARAATRLCLEATEATRGGLVLHRGRRVLTSYVTGALWAPGASTGGNGQDPTETEHAVTYNDGLVGAAVVPTPNAGKIADNRGCLSQNGAVELGRRGHLWPAILRYFYGADLDFTCPEPSRPSSIMRDAPARRPDAPRPASPSPTTSPAEDNGSKGSGSLLVAAVVAAYRMFT
jgi:lysophospholipase L1-like esterase